MSDEPCEFVGEPGNGRSPVETSGRFRSSAAGRQDRAAARQGAGEDRRALALGGGAGIGDAVGGAGAAVGVGGRCCTADGARGVEQAQVEAGAVLASGR